MKNKKIISLVLFFNTFACIFAQNAIPHAVDSSERFGLLLEKAELAYDSAKFEDAIVLVEKAKDSRKAEIDYNIYILDEALKPVAVQKVGDNINNVLAILKERNSNTAIELINKTLIQYGSEKFHNSITELYNFYKSLYEYPEADFLMGKLFFLEGDYKLANKYYMNALENYEVLDIKETKFDILYNLAELAQITNESEKLEKTLLLITAEEKDNLNMNMVEKSYFTTKDTDRFFSLYRTNKYFSLKAYIMLADFYLAKNEYDKALKASLNSVLTAFSIIETTLKERDYEYKYSTVQKAIMNCVKYMDVEDWAMNNDVWKGFYQFAQISKIKNKTVFFETINTALYFWCPDEYWKELAFIALKN